MIKVFLAWLYRICRINKKDIHFRISLHKNSKNNLNKVQEYWADTSGFSVDNFQKIDWKKNKVRTNRKNVEKRYFGLLNVYVKKSTNLNRKIEGWVEGICKKY